ncbi:surface carbohydrate biosynthesis protein [Pseudodesulfovibrio sp.]|uniref:surface carbohydrate biosynthesis protein n=1 Tax=unclassified Pseudodesulfovibrio TaxID=2661612 RepID=UPI003B00DA40
MLCAIPIEIANRELDAVLYLALHLAGKGLPTLLGDYMVRRWVFQFDRGKPVIYFDQDQSLRDNQAVLDTGGVVFNLNQEGLVLEEALEQADYARAVRALTMLFAWGEAGKKNVLSQIPQDKWQLVKVTGHPSFDLVKKRFVSFFKDPEIIAAHGEGHIQINTNFSYANLKMDLDRYIKMLSGMDEWNIYSDKAVQDYVWKLHDFQTVLLERYIELAGTLSENFPDRHVVFRPHPMENRERYIQAFRGMPNVYVDNSKSVRNWLASAGAVIHYDCTTGAEALLMERPVIGYRPIADAELTNRLFVGIGVPTETPEAVVEAIRVGGMSETMRQGQLATLTPYLANLEGGAAERIAEYAASCTSPDKVWLPRTLRWSERLECYRKYFSKLLRARQPGHNGRKVRYALEKFPLTNVKILQDKVQRLQACEPSLPTVSVEQVALNTFLIVPN